MRFSILLQLFIILPFIAVSGLENGDAFPANAVPKVFQVSIQATDTENNSTTLGKEFYDEPNGRGSVISWAKDGKTQATFKKRTDNFIEYFTVLNDAKCDDVKVEPNNGSFANGKFIMSTAYYFTFLPDMLLKSKTDVHMGITAHTFEGVVSVGGVDADAEFVWSAKDNDWEFPNCPSLEKCTDWWVPLKTKIMIPQPDNNTLIFTYIYYDYKNVIDDPETFQLPRGVACNLLENTKPFPTNLPDHFEAGVEIYYPFSESQITAKERIYYNMRNKLIRDDINLPSDMMESEDETISRKVWDYNTGVVYEISIKNGNCTPKAMSNDDLALGNTKVSTSSIFKAILHDNVDADNVLYVGVRQHRSMMCDVWIINVTDSPTEIYIVNETATNEDGIETQYSVPIFYNMSNQYNGLEMQAIAISFFNYDIRTPYWSRFDISSCFSEDYKTRFQIELTGPYLGVIDQNPNNFIMQVQKQLASAAKVLPNRFQEIMIDYVQPPNSNTSTVLFTTTLVENPFNAGKIGNNEGDVKTISQVYEFLNEKIFTSTLEFTFNNGDKIYTYPAISIRDDIVSVPLVNKTEELQLYFTQLGEARITKGDDFSTTGISRMECYENCVDSLSFECKTWSYCKDSGECVLSSFMIEENKEDVNFDYKAHTNCEIYTRDYIKDYVLNRETVTEAVEAEIGSKLEASSESECASKCSTDETLPFYCEGFDVCQGPGEKVTCHFRGRHILEMDASNIKTSQVCNHYTRDYLGDFLKFKNKSAPFKDYDHVVATETDIKDCARMCTTSADVNACKAFEICSPGGEVDKPRTQCRLLEASKVEARQLYDDPSCDHYTRNHFIPARNKPLPPDSRKTASPPTAEESKLKSGLYSSGSMAGLAFGMIILGTLVGGACVLGIMKYKILQH